MQGGFYLTTCLTTTYMKTPTLLPLVCFSLFLSASPLFAKKKHHGDPSPTPTPASDVAAKPDILPSVSLQSFIDAHLSQILSGLGDAAFDRPELLVSLKAAYADGQAAAPAVRKPAYQVAQSICDAMTAAMSERQQAVEALKGSKATESSQSENQPKGGRKANRYDNKHSDTFFADGLRNTWSQRADVLRKNIMALYLRERDLERQAIAAAAAASPAPSAAPATSPAADADAADDAPTSPVSKNH